MIAKGLSRIIEALHDATWRRKAERLLREKSKLKIDTVQFEFAQGIVTEDSNFKANGIMHQCLLFAAISQDFSARSSGRFFDWCASMRRRISSSMLIAPTI